MDIICTIHFTCLECGWYNSKSIFILSLNGAKCENRSCGHYNNFSNDVRIKIINDITKISGRLFDSISRYREYYDRLSTRTPEELFCRIDDIVETGNFSEEKHLKLFFGINDCKYCLDDIIEYGIEAEISKSKCQFLSGINTLIRFIIENDYKKMDEGFNSIRRVE